jgi:hypothetical protein
VLEPSVPTRIELNILKPTLNQLDDRDHHAGEHEHEDRDLRPEPEAGHRQPKLSSQT